MFTKRSRIGVLASVGLGMAAGLANEGSIVFRNIAGSAGVHFVLENSASAKKHLIETMPGGVAIFDYNNDGRPDLYFTNGAAIPSLEKEDPRFFNRLYRNDGAMRFTDVTDSAGVAGAGYSMGVAAADYDNDGNVDLFVAGVNRNILFHNSGNGKFEDVTARSGIRSDQWTVAAGWLDYDNDGKLDLWVVRYAKWTVADDRYCGDSARGLRIYCHPKYFEGLSSILYHNMGNGVFEDVSKKSGIAQHAGRGMSVAFADYDGDGLMDVFVTNDGMENFLFHNLGNGTFEETGLLAGVALPDQGRPVSSMGADFRDYDNDGRPDIAVTALANETFPLFRNRGEGMFTDATFASRVGSLSIHHSGWGIGLFDFNNDGWKDFFTAQSHVNDRIEMLESAKYKEANGVFLNTGGGTFVDVSAEAGQNTVRAHRGSAYADLNGDGKIDVIVSCLREPAEVWENISGNSNHWIILKLVGMRSNRDGLGARIRIGSQMNQMTSSVSYASSSHAGVHFGLGKMETIPKVEILWPSGAKQILTDVKTDQVLTVREK